MFSFLDFSMIDVIIDNISLNMDYYSLECLSIQYKSFYLMLSELSVFDLSKNNFLVYFIMLE